MVMYYWSLFNKKCAEEHVSSCVYSLKLPVCFTCIKPVNFCNDAVILKMQEKAFFK